MNTPTTIRRNLIATGAGIVLAGLVPVSANADAAAEAAIENRLQQYETRFNEGDAEALSRLFAEDVAYYGPLGQVFEGREAVRQRYRGSLEAGFSNMKVEPLDIHVFGRTAYDIARYTITDPGGKPLTGYHLAILEKTDGKWVVQRTLVNAQMPAPPAE